MAKRLKTVTAGRLVYGVCYTTASAHDSDRARAEKRQASSAARERINLRTSWQKLEMLLAANFGRRDLMVTLTYDDEHLPPNREAAVKETRKFLRLLREHRKPRGEPTRYVYTTEQWSSEGQRLHHHLVLNGTGMDGEVLRSLWANGQVEFSVLDDWDGYEALAKYLTKEAREHGRPEVGARSWSASLGLKKPKEESRPVPDNVTLSPPPGAIILDKDERRNGYGEYTYIKYLLPSRGEETKKGIRPPRKRTIKQPRVFNLSGNHV